ncbi:MAG: DNA replication/repair protein RecF [Thermoleophilia bacterium]|nr:DNA replication/repair protein RecF [Thermoleophilia bacterium]
MTRIAARDFRSYAAIELGLPSGLTVIVGPNGVGKTNLLDAVHVGTQGSSLRTRRDARGVRLGAPGARVVAEGVRAGGVRFRCEVTIEPGGKRMALDGVALDGPERLRRDLPVLAFTPDRLAVVKGGPLVRRTYLDRALARIQPARAALPGEYGRALAQRNAALRRARLGLCGLDAVEPWSAAVATLGARLDAARGSLVQALAERLARAAARLGLPGLAAAYEPSGVTAELLERRLNTDLERGLTGAGPHLSELSITASGRELRLYGSQGEQRLAVLALLLAEAEAVGDLRGEPPLLLLDDVLSELDARRRAALLEVIPEGSQTLVTATARAALPDGVAEPALVIDVEAGRAVPR